ncbi:class E sortase [Kitasatospora sp. NPDC093102]|uniref:class E sortase n=1 Tax=Kitasatospora sp. NPDC093102 TaxID=3155069 RepID=UPI00342271F6
MQSRDTHSDAPSDRLSRWSWSVQQRLIRQRVQKRRFRLSRASSVALLAVGVIVPAPLLYELTVGDGQAQNEAAAATAELQRSWQQAAASAPPVAAPPSTTAVTPVPTGPAPTTAAAVATPAPTDVATASPTPSTTPAAVLLPAVPAGSPGYPAGYPDGKVFAVLHLPSIGVLTAIAEGVEKDTVLDRGLIGHYSGSQETAFPWESTGNFALAAHRLTHGQPFQRLDRLKAGDEAVVETASQYFVYRITGGIDQTSPEDVGVIKPVPTGSGFTKPGRYLTLTTCTPEYSSTYRLIKFGQLVKVVQKTGQSTGIPSL